MGLLQDLMREPSVFARPRAVPDADVVEILAFAQERYDAGWPVHTFSIHSGSWIGADYHPTDLDLSPVIVWIEQIGWKLDRLDWMAQPSSEQYGRMGGDRTVALLFRRAN